LVHLPSQLAIKISTFSNRTGKYEDYHQSSKIRFGHHASDGSYVEFDLLGDGSSVNVQIAKPDDKSVIVRSTVTSTSEWALRFWTLVEIGILPPTFAEKFSRLNTHDILLQVDESERYGTMSPRLECRWGDSLFRAGTSPRPVRCDLYDELSLVRDELDERGYYFPHPEQESGNWAVLRFSAQEQPVVTTALAEAIDVADADRRVSELLSGANQFIIDARERCVREAPDVLAVRDVVAWNTMWDAPNSRYFTALSRGWVFDKFGGWGVWLNDVFLHALMALCAGDHETARANLDVVMSGQQPNGMLPCLLTAYTQWIDRSQPPIAAYVVLRIALRAGDEKWLDERFDGLLAAHDWWFANRDGNADGLLEWGSSPVGSGTFVHSKQAAMDESAMDNLPVFDEAEFIYETHTLNQADVGLNSLLVLEAEVLARAAGRLGRQDVVDRLESRRRGLQRQVIERMWDSNSKIFANLNWDETFASKHAPTSFYPLLAGIATEDQINDLVMFHLSPERRFGGERPIPSTPRDDPSSKDNVYWRGRIWPPLAFLTWDGLHRVGRHAEAAQIARHLYAMFMQHFESERLCLENYHLDDAARDVTQDSDPFYTWGGLIPLMHMLERADASPWEGLVLNPDESHEARLWVADNLITARVVGDGVVISTQHYYEATITPRSRLSHVVATRERFEVCAPSSHGLSVRFVTTEPTLIDHVLIDGVVIDGRSIEFQVPAGSTIRALMQQSD